ncbi:conserved hypothetical protein [Hahella chejuensis KCTC 2396]|uniref:DUF2303 family protein n=1 Tax=Hahella chejuensis (strain KCTC 2396) TaxID=349521 RepID=Q2SI86_HAHCH|nr:YfdQ family protein [Hahella chejuensis]ABC29638.1 conserved hypothetical protein [Hahella chejuensis KCTC 2396]
MDRSAIELIQQTAIAAAQDMSATSIPTVVLPDNLRIHSLEQYMDHPARFRGRFSTQSIDAFGEYCQSFDGAQIFVDGNAMDAVAIFDLGNPDIPGHAEHTAVVQLKKTAEFQAVEKIDGAKLSQRTMAEWLEDWRHNIVVYEESPFGEDAEKPLPIHQAISRIRSVTIKHVSEQTQEEKEFASQKTALERIEAQSSGGKLFWGIAFICEPYSEMGERPIFARLTACPGRTEVEMILRISRPEAIQTEIATEFADMITRIFEPMNTEVMNFPVHMGTFTTRK